MDFDNALISIKGRRMKNDKLKLLEEIIKTF